MNIHDEITNMGQRALTASRAMALLKTRQKNAVLEGMAEQLLAETTAILQANAMDMQDGHAKGLSAAMLDRLQLTEKRIVNMAQGLREVAALPDPVGRSIRRWTRPNGLRIAKVRVPIGVIGIIYESRPNVTADSAALCFKTSNATILRGGKEAARSNAAIVQALLNGGAQSGLPTDAIQLIRTPDREAIRELAQLEGMVDMLIPRGGEDLIRAVMQHARVPVIKHYKGVCHIFVDAGADQAMALNIIENAKCQRPGVCNAVEKVLIHKECATSFLPQMVKRLAACGVELRGDQAACRIAPELTPADDEDWSAEYLDLILAVRIVPSVRSAIDQINRYGSRHSDAIISTNPASQKRFVKEVDSAAVYINASTRFTDGGQFGMGAEIGISTDKLHARGPMGLEELTTYKYIVTGSGQVRA